MSPDQSDVAAAAALMEGFAVRTGLAPPGAPRRYLWTDAFAVCNYLGLARATGESAVYLEPALALVGQVHRVLGRHREDDPRSGWLSGLTEEAGAAHPTRGGLRIGKPLPERVPGEPFDEGLEWERDGQYFHYLTKWMHALDQLSRLSGEARYNTWARELAATAYESFTSVPAPGQAPRMVWKMSIALDRPLVPSMGQHDPLDGLVTSLQLRATAAAMGEAPGQPDLDKALAGFAAMSEGLGLASPDPLGIGGLLMDAWRLEQLRRSGAAVEGALVGRLLEAALAGLAHYARRGELDLPAERRLAFRELGLAIGLRAVESMAGESDGVDPAPEVSLAGLRTHLPLAERITAFWLAPAHRDQALWTEHRDINEVMLATSLVPGGFLDLAPVPRD